MNRIKLSFLAAFAALHLSGPALAQEHSQPIPAPQQKPATAGDLQISAAWARAMLPGQKAGGGYLTITNAGTAEDRLVAASSPAAPKVEIHEMKVVGDVMVMRPLAGLVIPAGATVELKPGGLHVMFMQVPQGFAAGGTVPLTLQFEKAGQVELQLPVRGAGEDHSGH